uniref:Retrotransposon gag domain-containing protein n=1 Tax=Nicotiana tabacum TaxID=4097 RepID=A0A1S4BLH1_TOBAC|nr:PREDICTED: uncharacterized protein LOC107809591 [Nicotiana tabacum]
MEIQLLGKNKLGIDHELSIEGIDTGIVYAKNARAVWEDLTEQFDKVNTSRLYQLHKAIATITQGTDNVSVYFSKLRTLWDEFDNMVPPPCDCTKPKNFIEFMQKQKVLQFLMGMNETYKQARSQILMTIPTPRINKEYSMLVERERQRSMANIMTAGDANDSAPFLASKGDMYRDKKGTGMCSVTIVR